MTYQEEIHRVTCNLQRLVEFGNAHQWLCDEMSYFDLDPSSRVEPRFTVGVNGSVRPAVDASMRERLKKLSGTWYRTPSYDGKSWHWEAKVDDIKVTILGAELREEVTPFMP